MGNFVFSRRDASDSGQWWRWGLHPVGGGGGIRIQWAAAAAAAPLPVPAAAHCSGISPARRSGGCSGSRRGGVSPAHCSGGCSASRRGGGPSQRRLPCPSQRRWFRFPSSRRPIAAASPLPVTVVEHLHPVPVAAAAPHPLSNNELPGDRIPELWPQPIAEEHPYISLRKSSHGTSEQSAFFPA
jgi:hypothetical protein